MHCNVLWFLDKHTLQRTALFIDDRASKLAINEGNASDDAGDY